MAIEWLTCFPPWRPVLPPKLTELTESECLVADGHPMVEYFGEDCDLKALLEMLKADDDPIMVH